MITLAQVHAQSLWVLGLAFGIAVLAGALVHRSHFCTMGAISDWVIMGDTTRLRQWVLAVAVAVLGLGGMTGLGWVNPLETIYATPRLSWLSLSLGGVLFGIGMVLSSGCPSKSLVRLGAGNLKSLVVLMAMGITALAGMRGLPAVWRVQWLDPVAIETTHPFLAQWLATVTALPLTQAWVWTSVGVAAALALWVFSAASLRARIPMLVGLGMGSMVVALWWVSGVLGFVSEHPETLEPVFLTTASGRMEAMSFTAPVAQWWDAFMYFSDGGKRIHMGMALTAGMLTGAWVSAVWEGTFRWEGFTHTEDLVLHLFGGALMGFGGVLAMGCSFGQGLSGLSTLSVGSVIAVSGMVLGAFWALRWQLHRIEVQA